MGKTKYMLLGFVGILMVFATAYIQFDSMDIERYGMREYLAADLGRAIWWETLGAPFLVGAIFLSVAFYGLKKHPVGRSAHLLFGGCFIVGCILSIVSGFGYLAAIAAGVCWLFNFLNSPGKSGQATNILKG